jgi:hypothetical protein
MTALNLRVDKEHVEQAKIWARKSGTSLSALVDSFLKSFNAMNAPLGNEELHPVLKNLAGSISASNESLIEVVQQELESKYGA